MNLSNFKFKSSCLRQAGKCQINVKFKNQKSLTFELWISFEI